MFDWLFNLFKPQQQQPKPSARPINVAVQGPIANRVALPQNVQTRIPQAHQPTGKVPAKTFIDILANYGSQYAQGVGGALQQGVGRPADELVRSILSFGTAALGRPQLNNPKPTGIESFIAGPEPINTIQTQTDQVKRKLTEAGQPGIAKFAPFLAPVLAGLDVAGFSPGKGQAKKAAADAAKAALKSGSKQAIENVDNMTVSSLGGQRIENFAQKAIEDALNAGDTAAAQKLVSAVKDPDLKAGLQSTIDALTRQTPKGSAAGRTGMSSAQIGRQAPTPELAGSDAAIPQLRVSPGQTTQLPKNAAIADELLATDKAGRTARGIVLSRPKTEDSAPGLQGMSQSYGQTIQQGGDSVNNIPPEVPLGGAFTGNSGGKIKTTRFASKTVPESPFVGPEVSKIVEESAPAYIQGNNKQQLRSALGTMQAKGIDTHASDIYDKIKSTKNGSILPQDAADAFAAAQALEFRNGTGDAARAADIYDTLSSHFTASGQLSQVAALLKSRSPGGVAFSAERDLKKAGVNVTDDIRSTISKLKEAITKTAPNSDERGQAVNELGKYVASKLPKSSIGKRLTDVWRAGLLTGPVTTTGNLLGNFSSALGKKAISDPIAALADRAQSLFTGKRTKTLTLRGAASGTKEGAKRGGTYLKTGYDARNVTQKYDIPKTNYGNGPLGKVFHNYTQAIYRYQGAQDQPFYYSAFKNSLNDQALAAAKTKGLKGAERAKFVDDFVKSPGGEAEKLAEENANRAVFANETKLGKAAAGLQKNLGPVGTFLVPFTRIPASIAMRVLDSTPIGTAREIVKQFNNMRKGLPYDQRAMSEAIGDGSIGMILISTGYALSKAGDITLGYPKDPKEQELWKQEGKQPYSVRMGDEWVSMNYVQPFGTLMAIGGQFNAAQEEGQDFWSSFVSSGGVGAQSIVNQSFLKGLQSTINAINDPQRYAGQFYEQTAGSIIPNFVRTIARATDPNQRQVEGAGQALQAGIPGLRENLPTQTDTFGNDLPVNSDAGDQAINPFRPSDVRATAGGVTKELRRLQDTGNGVLPNNIVSTSLGKDVKLDKDQIDAITRYTGPKVQTAIDAVIRDPRYESLSNEQKADLLTQVNRDVVGAYKAEWGVKNNLITPDQTDLTKAQKALLVGQQIDWVGNKVKSLQPKPPKQTRQPRQSKARKVSARRTGSRSGGRQAASAGPKVSFRAIRVASGKPAVRSLQTRPRKVASKIKGSKMPKLATAKPKKIKAAALA